MKLNIFFFVILGIEIYASVTQNTNLVYLTKPLLMPILMLIAYLSNLKEIKYYLALFFCLLGDIFLMFSGSTHFILGLSFFLIGHLFYILLFKKDAQFKPIPTTLITLITVSYFAFLYPHIESAMKIPVAAYCLVISTMGILAASRNENASFDYVLIGALLFILSDSLIAFNKFYQNIPNNAIYVMSTYGLAQFLILKGWLKRGSL